MIKTLLPEEEINRVRRLSLRAIELAYHSSENNPQRLAATLYFYNRIPVSKKWKERIPNEIKLLQFLGVEKDGSWPNNKYIHMDNKRTTESNPYWKYWKISKYDLPMKLKGGGFKLYISPQCEDLPVIISQLAKYVEDSGAHALKIGSTIQGLLRPDKLMVYFNNLDDAVRFGHLLLSKIFVNYAHGVPFTYPIGDNGLFSIGFDPPDTAEWRYEREGQSWRLWVTQHVADVILRVRKSRSKKPTDLILKELTIRKIDPVSWKPLDGAW